MSRSRLLAVLLAACGLVAVAAAGAGALGTDPGLPQQWGLRQIGAPTAWAGGALIGANVPIAIVDTGIDLGHEDLKDRIGARVTCVDTGGDPAKCTVDGADIAGHGSHVAGIAAASANDVGVSGVAPGARLIAVRVFQPDGSDFSASSADIDAGIRWVIRNVPGKGPINLSLGGDYVVTTVLGADFADGIEEAWAAGWLPVLASGNENVLGLGSSNYGSLDALVVGATGPSGNVASYSSPTGSAKWALVAPGGDAPNCQDKPADCILSTYKGGQYGFLQGTSMATPHVSGAAAVLMGAGMTNAQAVQRLLATADPKVSCGGNCRGRLDLAKAAAGLAPAAAPPATTAGSGGGAGTTTPPATAPTSGSSSSSSRSPRSSAGTATTASTGVGAGAPDTTAAPDTAAPVTATDADGAAPPPGDGQAAASSKDVTDLSISAARRAADGSDDGDDLPLGLVLVAVAAALATGGAAFVAARRRDEPARS